jgi:hypothetical protein
MASPLYKPPTKVRSSEVPYLALVTQFDPDFERKKHREVEYEFQGRVFVADPYKRGAYDRLSNVYAVGQPYGGLDAAITANLAPTVGNASPGLYQGTPDGKGWA